MQVAAAPPEGTHVFQLSFGAPDEANDVARCFKRHLK